ncbi:F-box domain protein [Talaromyces stipitatus ATCC 10500]|uniref:F-box domain protein n=1 Tax=Talaromyces stipitatus (strain ATCC 10500 / CBS 375.48 / QM 6759 / NRRL 1006) TaxID=441959 RepID=B8MA49_TALSN|nr:F-box domain protein [Talaromyces stipitatus ATCC 10500]EED18378.1 F-box domain protein [Talaromyces stipitatus ATCC 10500]
MLLDLPPELVQLVLKHCCTSAYIQAAFSCRTLYRIASSSRDVILHHLKTNPGPGFRMQADQKSKDNTERLTTRELFLLLRRGASEHLLNGSVDFDRTMYTFNGKIIDNPACSMNYAKDRKAILLVFKDDERIYHCPTGANGKVRIENAQTCKLPVLNLDRIRIIKTTYATDTEDLVGVIIKNEESTLEDDDGEAPPFFNEELQREKQRYRTGYLLLFLEETQKITRVALCQLPDDGYKVNALAAKFAHEFAISWEKIDGSDHMVSVYRAWLDDYKGRFTHGVPDLQYSETAVVNKEGLWVQPRSGVAQLSQHREVAGLGPVAELRYNDRNQLLHSHRGSTIFSYYHNLSFLRGEHGTTIVGNSAHRNYARIMNDQSDLSLLYFTVDIPFFATHETYTPLDGDNDICRWRYLSYAIGTPRSGGKAVACLLKAQSECRAITCMHETNLERGRRLPSWEAVAMLCGHPELSPSTIGGIFAASPNGTRVAVSNWNTLYVWALNPGEVILGRESSYYPRTWCLEEDDEKLTELRPVVIHMEAVCFKLMFTENDDVIVGLTDRGLMTWDLGPQTRRRRDTLNLDTENAPIVGYGPRIPELHTDYSSEGGSEAGEEDAGDDSADESEEADDMAVD